MKKLLLLAIAAFGVAPIASALVVSCNVTSGTVLSSTLGGNGYSINKGVGTSTGGATGIISCPGLSTGSGFIANYQVIGTVGYIGGPVATSAGTQVSQLLTLFGGPLNGSSVNAIIDGGTNPASVTPGNTFQIGSTLTGATSYAGFIVYVASSVTLGGPVGASNGQVVLSYDVQTTPPPSGVPEPSSYALMTAGLAGLGFLARRRK